MQFCDLRSEGEVAMYCELGLEEHSKRAHVQQYRRI